MSIADEPLNSQFIRVMIVRDLIIRVTIVALALAIVGLSLNACAAPAPGAPPVPAVASVPAAAPNARGAYVFQVAGGEAMRVAVRLLGSDGTTSVVDGPIDSQRLLVPSCGAPCLRDARCARLAATACGRSR
jgi:hypothetical protein